METNRKFLCDEMLQRVGRWLRVAGYDTLIAVPGTPDRELIALAQQTDCTFITRNIHA
ncbi:Mut7-C RNAse domain-containing protein [Pseudomonadota bacterium]